MAAAHVFDIVPHIRIIERGNRFAKQLQLHRTKLLVGGIFDTGSLGGCPYDVFIKAVQQVLRQIPGSGADDLYKLFLLGCRHLFIQACQTVGQGCECILALIPHHHVQHELLHGHGRLALQGTGIALD